MDLLLSQHLYQRRETRTQLQVSELERKQVGFEKEQFEEIIGGESTLEGHRTLLESGLISKREFRDIEREYERLKTTHAQLGLEERQLTAELGKGKDGKGKGGCFWQSYAPRGTVAQQYQGAWAPQPWQVAPAHWQQQQLQ